jgi:prepilin-type N-terminal cleavage/methylation domain-containing protein
VFRSFWKVFLVRAGGISQVCTMRFLKTPPFFRSKGNSTAQHGFTLIELLVVITVIAILAGLVLQTAGYVQKKAARSRAEAEIAALSAALESYKADMGDYPAWTNAAPATGNAFVRAALAPSTGKVYFEFSKGMGTNANISEPNQSILDPFGTGYCYQYPGNTNRSGSNFFDLWSRSGTTADSQSNQWIKNW